MDTAKTRPSKKARSVATQPAPAGNAALHTLHPEPPTQALSGWRVISAAVIGASHRKAGLPCQDATGWRVTAQGVLLAAAADGAGSAERSAEGARLAVQTALDYLEEAVGEREVESGRAEASDQEATERASALDSETPNTATSELPDPSTPELPHPEPQTPNSALLFDAFASARAALVRLADDENWPLRDFAATLSLAVAGEDYLLAGAIGDCAIICGDGDDDLITLIALERGEYANETHFLTGVDASEHIRLVELPRRARRLALFSDGLARLALQWPQQTPHRPFFAPLFAFAAGLPPAPAPGAAPQVPGQPADAPASAPTPSDENASIFVGAAAQLAAFLASDRVNQRTDDDKALVLAISA
jgi:hypothetical protein